MINNGGSNHQWVDLPKELLETIGKFIGSPVDIIRFRSVCSSWRSSVSAPSFDEEIPLITLKLPDPINAAAVLYQSTIYRTEFTCQNPNSPYSSSVSNQKGWLIKLRESRKGRLELLHPLTDNKIRYIPFQFNLLEFRFVQLSKAVTLKTLAGLSVYGINKVVSVPVSTTASKDEFAIVAIFHEGKLGYLKFGDETWTLLDETNFQYDDIIEFEGQFYVVDRWGTVSWIDYSLRLIQYAPSLFGCGGQKNLVESCGNLYIVDRYLEGERRTWKDYEIVEAGRRRRYMRKCSPNAIDFKVYKLDEEWGTWIHVKSLGDQIFVLGVDCSFSVSCDEFVGGKGNCIYFTDDDDYKGRGLSNDSIRVFRLDDCVIEMMPEYSRMFWPPKFGESMSSDCAEDQ
ncbi:putative F-box protein At1g65770 [Euphorbia lathyris]|uniref:putative F-box protein At1g65770 n=1 Tax=Euphorbia lathyris TaxID=212925 RepID=UPI00331338E6